MSQQTSTPTNQDSVIVPGAMCMVHPSCVACPFLQPWSIFVAVMVFAFVLFFSFKDCVLLLIQNRGFIHVCWTRRLLR